MHHGWTWRDRNQGLRTRQGLPGIPEFLCRARFTEKSEFEGVAYFALGTCSFLLQRFYQQAHADNFMMHLLVDDADAWHRRLTEQNIVGRYATHGVRISEPGDRPWGMRDFHLIDPSGVLWHIGHNTR